MTRRFVYVALLFFSAAISQTKTPLQWKTELPEDPKKIIPLQGGSYVFLAADEYAWLYETASGKKIWSVKVEDYVEKGMHTLVYDSLYIVSDDDTLKCYAIFQNVLLWKKGYAQVEQDRFTAVKEFDSLLVLTFGPTDLCINLISGAEVWRKEVSYEKDLIEQGAQNAIQFKRRNKYIAFRDDGSGVLMDVETGKQLLNIPDCEPNADFIKQKRAWYYLPAHEKYFAFISEEHVSVVDLKEDSILVRRPFSVNKNYNAIAPTNVGCGFFGEETFIHCNTVTGKTIEVPIEIDDVRNYLTTTTDSCEVMIVSMENKLIGINLDNGKILWQSAPKFPLANGFLHRFIASISSNVIVTYLDPSDDLKLYVMGIDAFTGKINFRTFVAHADESLPKRELPLPVVSSVNDVAPLTFGFENIGFDYSVSTHANRITILIRTAADMIEPHTKTDGGEGIVIIDADSGNVISKYYMKLAQGLSFKGGMESLAKPLHVGTLTILSGNKNVAAFDSYTGALRWMLIEQDVNGSYVIDAEMIDTVLYLRTGGSKTEYVYDQKREKLQTKKIWEEDDYTLLAVDTANGRVLWKKVFDADPAMIFPSYAVSNFHTDDSILFYGSEKFLYAHSMKKNSMLWSFEFSDSGVGSLSYDDLFAPSAYWQGENRMMQDSLYYFSDSTFTYASKEIAGEKYYSGISRTLQVNYSPSSHLLIAIGEDGIAAIHPQTGKRLWQYEWDYSRKAIQYRPMFIKDHLFYCINKKAVLINLKNGKMVWQTEIEKESGIFIMPNCSAILFIYKDEINGAVIP